LNDQNAEALSLLEAHWPLVQRHPRPPYSVFGQRALGARQRWAAQ